MLVLTTFDEDENVLDAPRAGAGGFLLDDTAPPKVVESIRLVARGEPMLSPGVTRRLIDRAVIQADVHTRARATLEGLSPREHEVVVAMAQGRSNADVAAELYMSVATVKVHISHVLTKLNLGNLTQVALLDRDAGLA